MSKEEQTWSVDIRHTQLGILFKCKEEDIEDHVHEFIKSELKNINWNYEEEKV